MILPFSTKLIGKPTYFPEKIITGLEQNDLITFDESEYLFKTKVFVNKPKGELKGEHFHIIKFDGTINHKPKLHTIREDKNSRWKVGTKIDFFINARQKNMYRFAPVLPVVRIQNFEIVYETSFYRKRHPVVFINNVMFYDAVGHRNEYKMLDFVNSDGFDTIEDFFDYFDKDYVGKIIHWTDLEY